MHTITAIFEDGHTVSFPARPGEAVYQAAYRASVRLAHDCLEGACGECKAWCTAGAYDIDDYSNEALSDDERAQGQTLLCKMVPRSSCIVELPYPADMRVAPARAPIEARVAAVQKVSSSVVRTLLDAGQPVSFLAGQYASLAVPGTGALRAYSFANAPGAAVLEFFHKLVPGGAMSAYLERRASAGDVVRLHPPAGHFYLREGARPRLMVAGGTGLAPMLAMLRELARRAAPVAPVHLLYGVNHAAEFFAGEELAQLSRQLPLTVERIAATAEGWHGAVGHATALLRDELLAADPDAYLCGPPPMIEAGTRWLLERGVDRRRIHAEKFIPS